MRIEGGQGKGKAIEGKGREQMRRGWVKGK